MARLIYPDPGSQLVYQRVGTNLRAANGQTATVYMDATGTTLANIAAYDPNAPGTPGAVISGSTLTVDTYSRLPSFWGPATGEDTLWVTVNNGPLVPVNSYYDPRIDAILAAGPVPGTRQVIAGAGLTGGGALSADVTLDVDFGTVAGTVAAGDAPAAAQAAAIAASQPVDADLTTIAGLDSTQSGVVASDGAGWLRKTYAALKTALSLVKGDVGLGNVDNTSDASKPVSTATQTALNLKASTTHATTHQPSGSDPMAVDAAAATGSLRTLGTSATSAAAGNDSRIIGAIPASLVDAKGDLIVGTGADAVARLAVGADNLGLVADSAQPNGVTWVDSIRLGFPANMIWCALGVTGPQIWATANAARYIRVIGSGTISKIAVDVSVQSGNISVAAYRRTGSGLSTKPGAQLATSGSVGCPAVGYAEVSLGASVTLYDGDFLAMSCDNTTASFRGLSGPSGVSGGMSNAYSWDQSAAHPLPAAPTIGATGSASRIPLLIGVA